MSTLDLILFTVFVVAVIGFGIWQGRKGKVPGGSGENAASDYFLAGRGLSWWLVGFSLIAANISTEQFVGMSGQAADWLGMAIASYEWMAAVTLIVVGFAFLPRFLQCGLYTIPEFLEYRFDVVSRTVMAIVSLVILVGVPTASVVFSGAKVISVFFHDTTILGLDLSNITVACWIIGISAAVYVFIGGLKSCAWTDLIWGSCLILGGAVVAYFALHTLGSADAAELIKTKVATSGATVDQIAKAGALERFQLLNAGEAITGPNGIGGKLHMIRPASDPSIPWTALIVGLWIPNFFYWGLNQYIMQRTLGSKSLAEGQKGIVLAATLKLIVPFIVVIPGVLAFNLYSNDLQSEAQRKNDAIIAQVGTSEQIIPFSSNFADLNPDIAAEVIEHNASILGVDAPEVSGDSDDLVSANSELVGTGMGRKLPVSTTLIGYDYDSAFPVLLRNLLKPGFTWFVLAAIFGAVVSSLASMLNSASTIATMDIYNKLRKGASQRELVSIGRFWVVLFILIACMIAPGLGNPKYSGIFTFIQEFQGFVSPGVLAVFIFGFFSKRTPRFVGWLGILTNVVVYGSLKMFAGDISFLNRMALSFGIVCLVAILATIIRPASHPVELPRSTQMEMKSSRNALFAGIGVCVATVALYIIFW